MFISSCVWVCYHQFCHYLINLFPLQGSQPRATGYSASQSWPWAWPGGCSGSPGRSGRRGKPGRRGRGRGRGEGGASQRGNNEQVCFICLSTNIPKSSRHIVLPCKHKMLHSTCYNRWKASGHNTCPICRGDIEKDMKYNKWVQDQLAAIEASTLYF